MALPLTLVILLFGSVLVATAFYIVQNMYSTSRRSVTHTELYNVAQTGVELAKTALWEKEIRTDEISYNPGDYLTDEQRLDAVRAVDTSGNYVDRDLQDLNSSNSTLISPQGVNLSVYILDCNYKVVGTLGEDDPEILPPLWVSGEGIVTSVDIGPPEGTSVIIDPSRYFNLGGGGSGQRRYVIRSTARHADTGMDVTIEAMVVVRKP
jgi:hypothetical protein